MKIDFGWESEDEKLRRYMKIPAKKKLEWLREMHEFTLAFSSNSMKKLRWKLRQM